MEEEKKPLLVMVDLEPDDLTLIGWLIRGCVRNCSIMVGKGDVDNKLQWLVEYMQDKDDDIVSGWKIYRGLPSSDGFPEFPGEKCCVENVPAFSQEKFLEIIESHGDILSSKPVNELLSLPEGTRLPGHRLFATMSFNFRDASTRQTLDQDARKLIDMFPDGIAWIESFPAIGSANADRIRFKDPVLSRLQHEWNAYLLERQLTKLPKKLNQFSLENASEQDLRLLVSDLKRTAKSVKAIEDAGLEENCLLVDAMLAPLYFEPERFKLTPVEFKGHSAEGYPVFEPTSEKTNLYQARGVEGLRDYVLEVLKTF